MLEPSDQIKKALNDFRAVLAGNAAALAHFARVVPELERRLADPRDPIEALVWDWFNAHYPGSPASCDPALWAALIATAVPALIKALTPQQAES